MQQDPHQPQVTLILHETNFQGTKSQPKPTHDTGKQKVSRQQSDRDDPRKSGFKQSENFSLDPKNFQMHAAGGMGQGHGHFNVLNSGGGQNFSPFEGFPGHSPFPNFSGFGHNNNSSKGFQPVKMGPPPHASFPQFANMDFNHPNGMPSPYPPGLQGMFPPQSPMLFGGMNPHQQHPFPKDFKHPYQDQQRLGGQNPNQSQQKGINSNNLKNSASSPFIGAFKSLHSEEQRQKEQKMQKPQAQLMKTKDALQEAINNTKPGSRAAGVKDLKSEEANRKNTDKNQRISSPTSKDHQKGGLAKKSKHSSNSQDTENEELSEKEQPQNRREEGKLSMTKNQSKTSKSDERDDGYNPEHHMQFAMQYNLFPPSNMQMRQPSMNDGHSNFTPNMTPGIPQQTPGHHMYPPHPGYSPFMDFHQPFSYGYPSPMMPQYSPMMGHGSMPPYPPHMSHGGSVPPSGVPHGDMSPVPYGQQDFGFHFQHGLMNHPHMAHPHYGGFPYQQQQHMLKVPLPPRKEGEAPSFVYFKQARRILIMRAKKAQKHELGHQPNKYFTRLRQKYKSRQKVAKNRQREGNGRFKKKDYLKNLAKEDE
eukprot:403343149